MSSGIIHDFPSDGDDGKCPTDPDVAGIGVVVSYVFAAALTTSVSIAAAILDEMLQAETAFLPKRLVAYFIETNDDKNVRSRRKFYRNVLDRMIIALADQQLVTGFALMLTGWIVYFNKLWSAHFSLVIYLSSLSSSSHLAALVILRKYFKENPTLALLRIVVITVFAVLLAISIGLQGGSFGPFYAILWLIEVRSGLFLPLYLEMFVSIWPILWLFWTAIWQILPAAREQFQAWSMKVIWPVCQKAGLRFLSDVSERFLSKKADARLKNIFWSMLRYIIFLSPCTVFMLQLVFALISVSLALAQKFSPGHAYGDCSLNSSEENKMGYGQILAILMLALPLIATIQACKEEETAMRIAEATEGLAPLQRESAQNAMQSSSSLASSVVVDTMTEQTGVPVEHFLPPSRQDTEQRIGDSNASTTTRSATTPQQFDATPYVTQRKRTWES